MNPNSMYGRNRELDDLREQVALRRSFLLHGPTGVGKTLLMKCVLRAIPEMLYCAESSSSQMVFRTLATELFLRKNRHLVRACGGKGLNTLKKKSVVALRGLVAQGLREAGHWVVLDHVRSPSPPYAHALKDVCGWGDTPLIAVARSAHMEDVGSLMPIFSERAAKFSLQNFDTSTARGFALHMASAISLQAVNREEAVEKIAHYSKGNPAAIVAMLQMAVSPKYVTRGHIKLSPLYIDFRLRTGTNYG